MLSGWGQQSLCKIIFHPTGGLTFLPSVSFPPLWEVWSSGCLWRTVQVPRTPGPLGEFSSKRKIVLLASLHSCFPQQEGFHMACTHSPLLSQDHSLQQAPASPLHTQAWRLLAYYFTFHSQETAESFLAVCSMPLSPLP